MVAPARILVVDDSPTILKVVATILARHGYEPTVARAGIAGLKLLSDGLEVDLVLLDFVMPRMNGYQFCRELRSLASHHALPVVLMSAKGDKIRGQFVQQTGAVDAITKPFDARALVAVVEGALAKAAEGRARPVPDGTAMPDEESIAESLRPSVIPQFSRQRAGAEFAQQVASALVPALSTLTAEERIQEAPLLSAIARAMSADLLSALATTLRGLEHAGDTKEVMSGDIAAIPLAEILQVLQMQRQTGVLRVMNTRTVVTLWLREGLIDLVGSHGTAAEFRLGRYFVEKGLLTRGGLQAALQEHSTTDRPLGETLVESGRASQSDIAEALTRQSCDLVYEVLRWPFGRFSFTREPFSAQAEAARLGLGVSGLVLEGFRRVDEWRLMEGTIQFDGVVVVDSMAAERVGEKLTRTERLVLDAVDGQRTVSEIIKESTVGSFDAIKAIYQFLQSRVLRPRA
jgi:DNA-binding response OmpR family regulator